LLGSNRTAGLEVNAEKIKCVSMTGQQNARLNHNMKVTNKNFEGGQSEISAKDTTKYLGKTPPNIWERHHQISGKDTTKYLGKTPPNIWERHSQISGKDTTKYLGKRPPNILEGHHQISGKDTAKYLGKTSPTQNRTYEENDNTLN